MLHTPGGLVLAATQIARAIFKRSGKVTVFVPHYAMSGGTLIALVADGARRARRESDGAARDFFRLLDEATPRWLRGGAR